MVKPISVYLSINLNNKFNPKTDNYKYQINGIISKVDVNINPQITYDILRFKSFMEIFSYMKDIKRFRPLQRVSAFINCPHSLQRKKRLIIRDWF